MWAAEARLSRRAVEAESVFGKLEQNWMFRRFLLRRKEKVEVVWESFCIAHNMASTAGQWSLYSIFTRSSLSARIRDCLSLLFSQPSN